MTLLTLVAGLNCVIPPIRRRHIWMRCVNMELVNFESLGFPDVGFPLTKVSDHFFFPCGPVLNLVRLSSSLTIAKNGYTQQACSLMMSTNFMEIMAAFRSPEPTQFVSHHPVHQDCFCNGLRDYLALELDGYGAKQLKEAETHRNKHSTLVSRRTVHM